MLRSERETRLYRQMLRTVSRTHLLDVITLCLALAHATSPAAKSQQANEQLSYSQNAEAAAIIK